METALSARFKWMALSTNATQKAYMLATDPLRDFLERRATGRKGDAHSAWRGCLNSTTLVTLQRERMARV